MYKWIKRFALPLGLACVSIGVFLLLLLVALPITPVSAAAPAEMHNLTDDDCLACHQKEGMTIEIGGQPLSLVIDQ